jgi:hypothetical protein
VQVSVRRGQTLHLCISERNKTVCKQTIRQSTQRNNLKTHTICNLSPLTAALDLIIGLILLSQATIVQAELRQSVGDTCNKTFQGSDGLGKVPCALDRWESGDFGMEHFPLLNASDLWMRV